MKKMTRVVSLLLAVVMVLSMAVLPASAAGFRDVKTDAWYAEAVDYVTARGYMAGTGEDTFAPNAAVTRAMFVTVLAKMAGAEIDNDVHPFEDVPAGTWYSGAVAWAAEQGIVSGTGAGKFSPNKNITRQDMSLILANFVMATGYKLPQEGLKSFTDADKISAYAREAVDYGTSAGLMSGYSDGTFRPAATATRAQLAVIVMALDKKVQALDAEPVPMPAQSFEKTASGIAVGVKAPVGAVPAGTELQLGRVTDTDYLDVIGTRIGADVLGAVDISFMKDGAELEPERAVEVEISMAGLEAVENPTVVHVKDDGTLEYVSGVEMTATKGARSLKFKAKDFSVYVLAGGEGGEQMLTVNFYQKEGDTTPINVQVIRLSQLPKYVSQNIPYVYDPGVPEITNTQSFEGWKTNDYTGDVKKENLSVDEINTYVGEHYTTTSTGGTLNYYAMIYEVRYVVYHDQAGAVLTSQAFHVTKTGETVNPTDVKIDWTYVGFKGEQNFAGWVAEDKVDVAGDYPLYKDSLNTAEAPTGDVYMNGATYTLSDTLQLYPYLNTGHWLVFDTYKDQDADSTSTSYIGPVFYEEGKNTVAPEVPTRVGYEFKGWFKDKQFTNRFIFGSPISEDTTVYAKWEAKNTTYQVVFWQQNVTDAVDAEDSAKTYSFYKSETRGALTGSKVNLNLSDSGTAADNRLGGNSTTSIGEMGYFFTYNETNSDTDAAGYVVNGDGSTVLNVYYDRRVITYNFYGDLTSYTYYSSTYNSNYPYYGVDSSNNLIRVHRSGNYWYNASNTRYTGTVYHLTFTQGTSTASSAEVQFGSIQGLWFSTMDSFNWGADTLISGNDWPYCGQYLMWHDENTGRYQNKAFQYELGTDIATEKNYFLNEYERGTSTRPYTCLGQDTSGNYTITLDEDALKSNETVYFNGTEYYGYTLSRYSLSSNNYNNATVWDGKELGVSYSDIGSNGHAYFFYSRSDWDFVFESNSSQVKTETVPWEGSLSDLASYVPTNGPEGTYFDGWFADPGLDTPFDFTQEMPNHSVMVYAKWTVERFRIVLDPTGGEQGVDPSDITFPGNQATTFRVDYGELVQASSINNAQREGYTLLGWFLDKEYTKPFNFANPVTDAIADMTYADASDAERQGVDPWTLVDGQPNPYSDVGRDNVRGKVTIYAHWRQDPDGVIGVNVHYVAKDKENHDGTFSDGSREWDDPNIYADQAMAFGQPASKPDNSTALQFLYWEILDKDNNVVGKAYPGQLWKVDFNNAKEEAVNSGTASGDSAEDVYYTYGQQTQPVRGPGSREVTTLTTTLFSDNFDDGTAFTTSTSSSDTMSTETWTAYKVGNGNNWSNYNGSSYAHSGSRSARYEYSSSYAANCYLISHPFKVSSNASSLAVSLYERVYSSSWAEQFEVFFIVTDGVTTTGNAVSATHYNVISSASYTNATYAEKTGSPSNLDALKGKNVRLVIHCTSAANMARLYIDDVNVTETKTGETVTYELANEIEAGKDYIIVVGDTHAVTNTVYANNRYINAASVVNNGDGTVTLFADQESSLLYRVGGSSSGWTFYNQAAGKYLGLNASDSHWLSMISTGWEWLYTGTDLDNQCTDSDNQNSSGNAFRYLSYSTTYDDFTTSTGTGQNVKFYKAVKAGYTVKFMDGHTNTQIGEDQIVPEGGSAVAPEAPDHTDQGMIFNGWDTPFDNITEDTVVTAQYVSQSSLSYTVTFRYMNSSGEWVSESQTVQHGSAATPPIVPTPPTGYTFNSWDKKYNNVTSNLTINAVYKQVATKKYVVTLRAVYGRSSTDALTHIYWYANNGTEYHNKGGERDEQVNLTINYPYDIPTPATWTGDQGGSLVYRGRKFLGWARVENTGSGEEGSDQSALNSVADCWLVYDETSGKFTVNKAKDPDYTGADGTLITQVAADEMTPYHDLYAVWAPTTLFYVFHSATGKLEAIDANDVKGSDGTGTYNLTSVVTPGYLYGGYYKQYGYISAEQMQTVVDKYEKNASLTGTGWTASTTVVNNVLASYTVSDADATDFALYRGAAYTNGTDKAYTLNADGTIATDGDGKPILASRVWENAQAYKEANGDAKGSSLVPEGGTVYYLKEVPEFYLTSRLAWTYDTVQKGKVVDVYLLSVTDDNNYSKVAFRTVDGVAGSGLGSGTLTTDNHLAKTFTLVQRGADGETSTAVTINPKDKFGVDYGYISVAHQTSFANADAFSMLPTWTTLDGVEVTNDPVAYTRNDSFGGSGENTFGGFDWQRVYDGNETLYVNLGEQSWWLSYDAVTVAHFCKGTGSNETSKDVLLEHVTGTIYVMKVPAGEWDRVLMVRCDPSVLNSDLSNLWDAKWSQTSDIPIPNSADENNRADISCNYMTKIYGDSDYTEWAIYPTN